MDEKPVIWAWGQRLGIAAEGRFSGSCLQNLQLLLFLQDLVAWVTASFLHIPHAEDVPNTVTLGNRVGFAIPIL